MEIELKESFEESIKTGLNLFLGAGFSIYAKDLENKFLPTGSILTSEIVAKFNCPQLNDLSKVCTIVDSFDSNGLKEFLVKRFTVNEYSEIYLNLLKVNTKRIFTTNIDDLPEKIYSTTSKKYLSNVFINGSTLRDENCVDYIPLHGNVNMTDIKFLFNKQEVSGSYKNQLQAWQSLSLSATEIPSLFLGYSFEDAGAMESLFGSDNKIKHLNKWILLRKKDEGTIAYFKALGFNIIIGDVKSFLEYLPTILKSSKNKNDISGIDSIEEIYPKACVPKSNYNGHVRSIDEFFLGAAPIWSDILSNRIHETEHVDHVVNNILKNKNLIVTGIPASGKSTILFQVAKKLSKTKRVLIFDQLSINKTNIIKNEVKKQTIIFVDNFTTDIDSFVNLSKNKLILLVGFDRYHNVDMSSHKLPNQDFDFYDVTDLSPNDIQSIYNTIPLSIRKNKLISRKREDEVPCIFEIINYNIERTEISKRYNEVLDGLNSTDPLLLDLLMMTCYLHACRIPVSFDVANSYAGDDLNNYMEVISKMESLSGMVDEVIGDYYSTSEYEQDYYQPRSQILAETIIASRVSFFTRMFIRFHSNVSRHIIPNFHVFKRSAFDSSYVLKAYPNWNEGYEFYMDRYENDKSPFLLQQCSLYLLKKKRYTEAAITIDKALQTSKERYFSIENTHAIILFKANIGSSGDEALIKSTLDKSMEILKKCYNEDKRKTYHTTTFAEQAIEYYSKYGDEKGREYLNTSIKWLDSVLKERQFHGRCKQLKIEIQKII